MTGRWLAGKVGAAVVTLIFVLIFNFFLFRVMGDPTTQLAKLPNASTEELAELRSDYGLDKPILGQFADYAGDTVTLDFGISQGSRESVASEIWAALPWTLLLVGGGTLLATLIGAWMGVVAASKRGSKTDDGLLGFNLFTYASPEYWIGIILILVFAVAIPILPAGQEMTPGVEFSSWFAQAIDVVEHMILPMIAMTLMLLGQYFLIMRSSMVDVMTEDFITVKRAIGLPRQRVINRHAVPNALLPLVTLSAIYFGAVVGGAITIETVFSWPGLGGLFYQALSVPDLPLVQGLFVVFAGAMILMSLIADLFYPLLDPRVGR
jgi:peptide/nickel transport system permease protein